MKPKATYNIIRWLVKVLTKGRRLKFAVFVNDDNVLLTKYSRTPDNLQKPITATELMAQLECKE